jgi:hypothetical protein
MADPLVCVLCGVRPRRSAHFNTIYCATCRRERLRRPRSNVTPEQADQLRQLAGHVSQQEIQQRLGLSKAAISRWLREQGLKVKHFNAPDDTTIDAVCRVYETGGRHAVEQQFPQVRVRSVIERYKRYRPRQIRWTAQQQLEAARMAGLVSRNAQARYFGRPNAYGGSIRSLWAKRFQCAPGDVNGLGGHLAWQIALPGVPAVLVPTDTGAPGPKMRVLWLDLAQWLKPDVDPLIRQMIETLAAFQQWLHATDDPDQIRAMVYDREVRYGHDHPDPERAAAGHADAGAAAAL